MPGVLGTCVQTNRVIHSARRRKQPLAAQALRCVALEICRDWSDYQAPTIAVLLPVIRSGSDP